MKQKDITQVIEILDTQGVKIPSVTTIRKYNGLEIKVNIQEGIMTINQTVQLKQTIEELKDQNITITPQNFLPDAYFRVYTEGDTQVSVKLFQKLVGSLLWFARMTRVDIAQFVQAASRVALNPTQDHLDLMIQCLGYLEHTVERNLIFRKSNDNKLEITVYTDSSWMDNRMDLHESSNTYHESGKSTSGCIIMINGTVLDWNSAIQAHVAGSAAAAELIAAYTGCERAFPILSLLQVFGYHNTRTIVFVDNQAAISAITSYKTSNVGKPMARRYAGTREYMDNGIFHITYIRSENNLADFLTKNFKLLKVTMNKFTEIMDVLSGHFYKTKQEYMDQVKFLCNEENFTTWNIDIKNYNQLRFVQNAEYNSRKNVYL